MLSRSCCSTEQSVGHLISRYSAVNSFRVELLTTICRSSMNSRNRIGPSTEPCGTPDLTGSQSELMPLMTALWKQHVRKE